MNFYNKKNITKLKDQNFNIRVITFLTMLMIFVLVLVYCLRVYSEKKQNVKELLLNEARNIQNSLVTNIYYSKYFLNFLLVSFKDCLAQPDSLNKTFNSHVEFLNEKKDDSIFSWDSFRFINDKLEEIISNDKFTEFEKFKYLNNLNIYNHFSFNQGLKTYNFIRTNNNLDLIYNFFSEKDYYYQGSIIFSYDINKIVDKLKTLLNEKYINFIIVDENYTPIIQTKSLIKNLINKEGLSPSLQAKLQNIDFNLTPQKTVFHFNIWRQENYYIKKINNLPFIIIINIDNNRIKQHFIIELTKKFIEVGLLGIMLLLSVISVYKRESYLRSKAEKATITANNATQAKSEFLAFTAHEIRSPLGFILTGSEIMSKEIFGSLPISYQPYAEGIHQNSKIILEFIKDILDENQIIEGNFRIVNSIFNITEIIKESIKINQDMFNNRNINIIENLENNLPYLIADKRRMLQIMNNLISNAIKYSKDDTTIMISSEITNQGLLIEVKDEGIGMCAEQLDNIAHSGGAVLKEDENIIESYGLGLLIVKMLIKAHEAKLSIRSSLGIGTTVSMLFPEYKLIYNYHN